MPASAARRAQAREDPARTRAHDVEELFAEVQSELDRPPAPPAAGPAEPTAARPAPACGRATGRGRHAAAANIGTAAVRGASG